MCLLSERPWDRSHSQSQSQSQRHVEKEFFPSSEMARKIALLQHESLGSINHIKSNHLNPFFTAHSNEVSTRAIYIAPKSHQINNPALSYANLISLLLRPYSQLQTIPRTACTPFLLTPNLTPWILYCRHLSCASLCSMVGHE
jgi:hypothetical protein